MFPVPDQERHYLIEREVLPGEQIAPDCRRRLIELDKRIRDAGIVPHSLCPGRGEATSCEQLGILLLTATDNLQVQSAFTAAFEVLVDSAIQHFPGSLFWDFDYIMNCAISCARQHSGDTATYLQSWGKTISELFDLFGGHSPIRFQYTHDFLYGFDATRWNTPGFLPPGEQQDFSLSFLLYIRARGRYMSELIEAGHPGFPAIPPGEFRNSYSFNRDPECERKLFKALAECGVIPLEGWSFNAKRITAFPYLETRNRIATSLDLESSI